MIMKLFKKINKWLREFDKPKEYKRLLDKRTKQQQEESKDDEPLYMTYIRRINDLIIEHEMKMNPLKELRLSEFGYFELCEYMIKCTVMFNNSGEILTSIDKDILMLKIKTGEEKFLKYKGLPIVVEK